MSGLVSSACASERSRRSTDSLGEMMPARVEAKRQLALVERDAAGLERRFDPAGQALREADRETPLSRAGQPLTRHERSHRRKIAVSAAEARVERPRQQDAARNVDTAPVAVQADLGAAVGAEIGVRRPGDIAEQARGKTDAAVGGILAGEQRCDPVGERRTMRSEAREATALEFGGDDQGILRARRGVERLIEQAFAKARR
nr:hypothetical protein [Sphingopyxis sp. PET50]